MKPKLKHELVQIPQPHAFVFLGQQKTPIRGLTLRVQHKCLNLGEFSVCCSNLHSNRRGLENWAQAWAAGLLQLRVREGVFDRPTIYTFAFVIVAISPIQRRTKRDSGARLLGGGEEPLQPDDSRRCTLSSILWIEDVRRRSFVAMLN